MADEVEDPFLLAITVFISLLIVTAILSAHIWLFWTWYNSRYSYRWKECDRTTQTKV